MKPMTPEDEERFQRIERLMEFIAANQAQLSASHQTRSDQIAENSKLIAENSRVTAEHSEQIGRLADAVLAITGIVDRIGNAQERTERKVAELAEAQSRTEARLNIFIGAVERYISEHRNGKE